MAIPLLPDDPLPFANMNTGSSSATSAAAMDVGPRQNDPELRQNGQETPTPLVKGANLPSLSIPSTYIRFQRCMITIHTEADFPNQLCNLDASEWKKGPFVRSAFKLAKKGRQKEGQPSPRMFSYCLLAPFAVCSSDKTRCVRSSLCCCGA